jgi:hypothetical protein
MDIKPVRGLGVTLFFIDAIQTGVVNGSTILNGGINRARETNQVSESCGCKAG